MRRRKILVGCGTVLAGLLAGCGGDGSSDSETPTSTPTADSTPTPNEVAIEDGSSGSDTPSPTETPTETQTPSDSPTPTQEPTATPTPSGNLYDLGERFTVGEGDNAIAYRIIEFYRSDMLGNAASRETADGTFLVVVLELTNPRDSRVTIPRGDFRVKSDDTWHQLDTGGSEKIGSDGRIDQEPLINQSVRSGKSITGAVAFDVNPNSSYRLWITPEGSEDTPEFFVPVGDISSVPELE